MKKSIFYYVSGHGFGHATRSVEVINALTRMRPDFSVYLRTNASRSIFDEMCENFHYHADSFDIGVIQSDGINMDIERTLQAYQKISATFPRITDVEIQAARAVHASLIVSDIPPVAMKIANKLNIPGLLVANFTWDWIYELWLKDYPFADEIISELREDYRKSSLILRLPLSPDFSQFDRVIDVPLIARKAKKSREEVRTLLGFSISEPLVLLSFGGMGLKSCKLAKLEKCRGYRFISLSNYGVPGMTLNPDRLLDLGIHYPDLVGAVDIVVSKPGYGIVSECAANNIKLLFTERGPFREYDILLSQMPGYIHSEFIDRESFQSCRWKPCLDKLMKAGQTERIFRIDGAEVIATRIVHIIEHGL